MAGAVWALNILAAEVPIHRLKQLNSPTLLTVITTSAEFVKLNFSYSENNGP